MCKSEIFARLLQLVEQETEISKEQILSANKEAEVVDARYILVDMLTKAGFYPSRIAVLIRQSKRSVNYILSNFPDRLKAGKMMRLQWDNIRKAAGNI